MKCHFLKFNNVSDKRVIFWVFFFFLGSKKGWPRKSIVAILPDYNYSSTYLPEATREEPINNASDERVVFWEMDHLNFHFRYF
jgi:hypothetical protein